MSDSLQPQWTAACQASLLLTISWSLPKFMSIASLMPTSHLILWCPIFLLPSIFLSMRVFLQWVGSSYQEAKVLASASVLPMSIQSWFPFKTDWFDHPVVQGTLMSRLQHHSSKASILQRSAFITVQLSQPYVTWGLSVYYEANDLYVCFSNQKLEPWCQRHQPQCRAEPHRPTMPILVQP